MSSGHFIFKIPELTAGIARYLTPSDVTNAMATCKTWSKLLRPFFWIDFSPKDKLPEMSVLAQNLHHIRAIDLGPQLTRRINVEVLMETLAQGLPDIASPPPTETVTNPGFTQSSDPSITQCINLRRVKIAFKCYEKESEDPLLWLLWTLLYHNRKTLTHLELKLDGINDAAFAPAVLVFSVMNRLQHLTIRSSFQSEAWFMAMLHVCLPLPRLTELFCHFFLEAGELSPSGDTEIDYVDRHYHNIANPIAGLKDILDTAIAARTSFNGSIDAKIKALRFPDPEDDETDLIRLVLPILRSELVEVEVLEVPRFLDNRPEELYEGIVRDYCPALRHLILPPYDDDCQMANNFIRAATGLKTVRGVRLSDEIGWSSRQMIRTLVRHHSKTLEEVELMLCRMIRSRDQQALFTSCKQLKRFWMSPDGMSEGQHGIEFRDIITGAWGCLGMRELSLTLNRSIDVKATLKAMRKDGLNKGTGDGELEVGEPYRAGDKEQERKAAAWAAKKVFAQIGRLTALEYLALGTDEGPHGTDAWVLESKWDLTLSKGYLSELAGLKNLRHFHMRTDHWSMMGQAEVEFMDAEWPWLDFVTFDIYSMNMAQFCEEVKLPHWQWLQQKRPGLRLRVIDLFPE